jgi:hypothetical protein
MMRSIDFESDGGWGGELCEMRWEGIEEDTGTWIESPVPAALHHRWNSSQGIS